MIEVKNGIRHAGRWVGAKVARVKAEAMKVSINNRENR
jgi:hypothetical protein